MTQLDPVRLPLRDVALIEASAGTGKTHTITTLVLRLLLEQELDVRGILVLTYTKAATAELRERVRARLADMLLSLERAVEPSDTALAELWSARAAQREADAARVQRALRDFDEAPIFTIHGFCQRVLGERALESGTAFDVQLVEDLLALIDELAIDLWEQATAARDPALLRALRAQGLHIDEVRKVVALAVREPGVPIVAELGPRPAEPDAAAVERARRACAELWRAERENVLGLIRKDTFNQTTHKVQAMRDTHALALDALQGGLTGAIMKSVRKLTTAAVREAVKKGAPPEHPLFTACDELSAAYAVYEEAVEALARYELGLIARRARELMEARKRQRGLQSFEDLLSGLARSLEGPSGLALARDIAGRYPALLVDEFQDTDPTQYAIFQRLHAGGMKVMLLIGDPKQAIYGFRGADVYAYLRAAKDAGERMYRLGVSYRSDPRLVHAVNTLFDRADPFLIPELTYEPLAPRQGARERLSPAGPALDVLLVSRDGHPRTKEGKETQLTIAWSNEHLPAMVASDIVRLLGSGARIEGAPVMPEDIAVLCRTNAQGLLVQEALSARGVPVALDGDSSVFHSETAEELCRVLAAMASPSDLRAVRSALATKLLGWNAEDLLQLEDDDAALAAWLGHLMRAHARWVDRGFVQAVHGFFIDARVHERLLARRDGQRRLTDALHLIELLHEEASVEHLGPLSLVRRLEGLRADLDVPSHYAAESAQLRLESDEHAVRITTVHRSKGLQYPIVYCPFLWSARGSTARTAVRFHDEARAAKIDVKSPDFEAHKQRAADEERAEALRLAYVALTRAKHRCAVVWGGFNQSKASALGALLGAGDGSDAGLRAELDGLRERSGGAIDWRVLPPADERAYVRPLEARAVAGARGLSRALPAGERLTSFSRLARKAPREAAERIAEGLDRDAAPGEHAAGLAHGPAESSAVPVTLAEFPAGPSEGTLVHAIYERIDFQRGEPDELPRETRAALQQGQRDLGFADVLVRGIGESLAAPFEVAGATLRLADIPRAARLSELEFMLEIERGSGFSPAAIAAALAEQGAPERAPEYPARIADLAQGAVEGFLRGFIDLVLRHEGRFYVVDYKSNHLGKAARDYAEPALRAAMVEHHYYLQAYLYTLALHRYLGARLPGYDYDRHVGGYAYLFVRGMSPAHPVGTGVLAERPPRALIERLSSLLTRKGGAA